MPRIAIADDHEAVRQGLRDLIERHEGWEICAQAASLAEVRRAASDTKPDIIILDLSIMGGSTAETVRDIKASSPGTEVLIFTMNESEETFRQLIAAGARGYLFKSDSSREIEAAIEALTSHRPYFTAKISDALREALIAQAGKNVRDSTYISPRERQIVQLLAEGKPNKEVAKILGISVKTVETHRATVMRKLGIKSVVELVHYAIRNQIAMP